MYLHHPVLASEIALWTLGGTKKALGLFLLLSPPLHFGVCEQSSTCATVLDSTGLVATSDVCSGQCFDLTWVLTVRDSIILDECILAAFRAAWNTLSVLRI